MPTVVGVRLRYAGKILHFDPSGLELHVGDRVVVATERGEEFGEVVREPVEVSDDELAAPLKPVVRVADETDERRVHEYAAREPEALETFRALIKKHGLDMKPVGVETLLDGSKMVFYFSAEERVDFRELVRELASTFKTRVDMRQIGVRDEARLVGGVGHCGEMLCCVRFGGEFQPVSIRMAKEQDLPLNPLKISGLCGRLMCCLRYEYEAYRDFKQRAPKTGSLVETPKGPGKVVSLDTPRERVTIRVGDGSQFTVPLEALECSKGQGCPCTLKAEALADLARGTVSGIDALLTARSEPLARESAPVSEAEGTGGAKRKRRKRRTTGSAQAAPPTPQGESAPAQTEAAQPARRKRRRRKPAATDGQSDGPT